MNSKALIVLFGYFVIFSAGADVVEIKQPSGTDYTYQYHGSTVEHRSCSAGKYYAWPLMDLPANYSFLGSYTGNISNPGVVGEYPSIYASGPGYQNIPRTTIWPVNFYEGVGLHWLCGTPTTVGNYSLSIPPQIKIRRTGSEDSPSPPQSIPLRIDYKGVNHSYTVESRSYQYTLVQSPELVTKARIISEDYVALKKGERKEVLRFEGIEVQGVGICWNRQQNNAYNLYDRNGREPSTCFRTNKLPLFVQADNNPPIGESRGFINFRVARD